MIEASAHETKEEELEEALMVASKEITKLEDFQKQIIKEIGKEKRIIEKEEISAEAKVLFDKIFYRLWLMLFLQGQARQK